MIALGILSVPSHNGDDMAKKKRNPKTLDPASFAYGIMQHVLEATGDKPDEPNPPPDQTCKEKRKEKRGQRTFAIHNSVNLRCPFFLLVAFRRSRVA
jgi:hypothetical protein